MGDPHPGGGGCLPRGGRHMGDQGSGWGERGLYPGRIGQTPPPGIRKAGRTHPTGILSCFLSLHEMIKNM